MSTIVVVVIAVVSIMIIVITYYDSKSRVKLPRADWKPEAGRARRRAEETRSEKRKVRRKKMQAREKVKSCESFCFSNALYFRLFPEGRKVSSLKRRVQSHLAR